LKKILIISYYWPPFAGSGVQRWLKFSKYLPEFGFKPYVYTPENPHFNVRDEKLLQDIHPDVTVVKRPIWEPYSFADFISGRKSSNQGIVTDKKSSFKPRILNRIRANYFIPDPRKFWVRPSIRFLKSYMASQGIGYLVTTGPPHSMHLIGLGLKRHLPELKWVVDIRDPWSRFDFLQNFGASDKAIEKQAKLEKQVLNACDRVIATSHQMKDLMVAFDSSKFECITNGYDREDFDGYRNINTPGEMIIYHAGLLNKVRNPVHLWKALSELCLNHADINKQLRIQLVGVVDGDIADQISAFPALADKLTVEPYKAHRDVIRDYGRSDVLLLLVNNTDNAGANIPGKLFEYIASDKSILLVSDPSTDAHAILEKHPATFSLDYSNSEPDLEQLAAFLHQAENPAAPDEEFKRRYERKNLTANLVTLLNQL